MSDVSSHEDHDRQLALLCHQLARLRRMHRGPVGAAGRTVIDRAVRAAREGGPIDEHLEALGLLPGRAAGDADEADEGSARGTTLPPRVADGAPHALLGHHVCPRGVCTRREQRAVGEERPVCEIFDLALHFDPER
ncbi:hypothetical protein ABZ612_39720 [Streptomyces avermitilis]|uniref:hypothetical protein n=1 Tax=Streptomyces avermitilis TaxID=33903 RepID=UPI0033CF2921